MEKQLTIKRIATKQRYLKRVDAPSRERSMWNVLPLRPVDLTACKYLAQWQTNTSTNCKAEGGREGGRHGGSEGLTDGEMEGGREGGR